MKVSVKSQFGAKITSQIQSSQYLREIVLEIEMEGTHGMSVVLSLENAEQLANGILKQVNLLKKEK